VSKHSNNTFAKLGLEQSEEDNRPVLAVLAYPAGLNATMQLVIHIKNGVNGVGSVSGEAELAPRPAGRLR
jgi:hypothetical protein